MSVKSVLWAIEKVKAEGAIIRSKVKFIEGAGRKKYTVLLWARKI